MRDQALSFLNRFTYLEEQQRVSCATGRETQRHRVKWHANGARTSTREMTELRRDQLVSREKPRIFTDNDPIATFGCALFLS